MPLRRVARLQNEVEMNDLVAKHQLIDDESKLWWKREQSRLALGTRFPLGSAPSQGRGIVSVGVALFRFSACSLDIGVSEHKRTESKLTDCRKNCLNGAMGFNHAREEIQGEIILLSKYT